MSAQGPYTYAGWHPEPVDDVALLRSELDACRAEIDRLRSHVGELHGILIDNVHALRSVLHGSSSAMACTPKEAWERTLDELRERLYPAEDARRVPGREGRE